MFGFCKKEIPSLKEFILKEINKEGLMSDEELMNIFGKRYMRGWSYSSIAKKLESLRKKLWTLKKDGIIKENHREVRFINRTGLTSCEYIIN